MLISGFNLAAANYRRSRRQTILAGGVAALLTLLLLGQLAVWVGLRRDDRGVGSRLERMESEFRRHQEEVRAIRAGIPAEAVKRYQARVEAYNQILEAGAFSWTGLLVELERSIPPGVALSEIHPDLATGKVALRGTARTFDEIGRLLLGLEQRRAFQDVYLLRQASKKNPAGGAETLEFAVTLVYGGRTQ